VGISFKASAKPWESREESRSLTSVPQGRCKESGKNVSNHGFRTVKAGDLAACRASGVCAAAGKWLKACGVGPFGGDFGAFPNRGRIVAKALMATAQMRGLAQSRVKAGVVAKASRPGR
jgi:hypothetical protein